LWNFYDFVGQTGRNEMREWYEHASETVQAAFDAKLELLNGYTPAEMRRPTVGKLQSYEDVYELRFEEEGTAWRPLFCFGPGRTEITFLVPAREVNNRFEPRSGPGIAAERAATVRARDGGGKDHVTPHDYP
jgi:hypothetical protein